jgi:hypothetical protein
MPGRRLRHLNFNHTRYGVPIAISEVLIFVYNPQDELPDKTVTVASPLSIQGRLRKLPVKTS